MAEVAAAVRALDLGAHAVGIGQPVHRARDLLVERGPAAVRVKLVVGAIERGVAAPADVGAGRVEVVVLAGEGPLGALPLDDIAFFFGQFVVFRVRHAHLLSLRL